MKNSIINRIVTDDSELFNRLRAYGPGDGLNRISVTVEDQASIDAYGLRETTESFTNATSRSDLETLATTWLSEHSSPVTEMDISLFFDAETGLGTVSTELNNLVSFGIQGVEFNGEAVIFSSGTEVSNVYSIRRGDTIRIVSQELELVTTGIIQELDWEPGVVNIRIGRKHYNLLDVILGPEEEEERKSAALGLPVPVGLRAQRAEPGCKVFVNPYVNSRAIGVEIHAGSSASFTPSRANMVAKGSSTEFLIPQLTSGQVFYFKARAYDDKYNYSEETEAVSAVSGFVQGGRIEGGTIDLSALLDSDRPIRIITNLPVVVSASDPDYKVGMLINYFAGGVGPGELRRLVSTTGVPETDWIKAVGTDDIQANSVTANEINAGSVSTAILIADAIKTNMIEAGAVTADRIAVGTITADRIAAKTITAGEIANSTITGSLIADSEITGSKISGGTITGTNIANATINGTNLLDYIIGTDKLENGDIEVSNATKASGAFIVKDYLGTEQVAMGNITGRTGVPSGTTQYGFWGDMGTNVYIRGAMRVINAGRSGVNGLNSGDTFSPGSYSVGDVVTSLGNQTIQGSFTVRTGTRWHVSVAARGVLLSDTSLGGTYGYLMSHYLLVYISGSSTPWGTYTIPAGSYSSIQVSAQATWEIRSIPTTLMGILDYDWVIYEEIL